jgi:nucleoside-diphosphate-sugar epimerase
VSNLKRVLITGKNSYVGTNVEKWLMKEPDKYYVESISVRGEDWKSFDFSTFDVVLHVAAIVHQSKRHIIKELYFEVNRDLPITVAEKAKKAGVSQFIFLSTMAVYGKEGELGKELIINEDTLVNPKTSYALSKIEAEGKLNTFSDDFFKVVVLRTPIVYGPYCPGNYARLEKLATKLPIFPYIYNNRSMLHIDVLCRLVKKYIDDEAKGLFFPQNDEYITTSLLVKEISEQRGKSIHLSKTAGFLIKILCKKVKFINKIFGNLVYDKRLRK